MKLRIECLPLNAMHTHQRTNESASAQQQRELCPCCQHSAETPYHYLFECTAYEDQRQTLHSALTARASNKLIALTALPDDQQWRQLLNPSWQDKEEEFPEISKIADFVYEAWRIRSESLHASAALSGREASGGNPEV